MTKRWQIWLPALLAAGMILPVAGRDWVPPLRAAMGEVTAQTDPYPSRDVTSALRLDGRIIALKASPDRTRIALVIHGAGKQGTHSLAVFDPARRQVLGRHALPCASLFGWSPDSRCMIAPAGTDSS